LTKKTIEKQMPLAGTEEGEILARLSERVEKAVKLIQELRRERDELKAKLEAAEGFSGQRQEIRTRIESILSTLESLEE
jgi:FtsZ-binding cell division protein ZapB